MKKQSSEKDKKVTWYPFRSLENYKSTQMSSAKSKGREDQLKAATTLTAARRIVYGR